MYKAHMPGNAIVFRFEICKLGPIIDLYFVNKVHLPQRPPKFS